MKNLDYFSYNTQYTRKRHRFIPNIKMRIYHLVLLFFNLEKKNLNFIRITKLSMCVIYASNSANFKQLRQNSIPIKCQKMCI